MFHGGSGGHVAALDVPTEPVGLDLVGERSGKPPIDDFGHPPARSRQCVAGVENGPVVHGLVIETDLVPQQVDARPEHVIRNGAGERRETLAHERIDELVVHAPILSLGPP
jgi:hypothetical protein